MKNTSTHTLYLHGKCCYITHNKYGVSTQGKKTQFQKLLNNRNDCEVVLDKTTAKKYISKIIELGYNIIEHISYDSYTDKLFISK